MWTFFIPCIEICDNSFALFWTNFDIPTEGVFPSPNYSFELTPSFKIYFFSQSTILFFISCIENFQCFLLLFFLTNFDTPTWRGVLPHYPFELTQSHFKSNIFQITFLGGEKIVECIGILQCIVLHFFKKTKFEMATRDVFSPSTHLSLTQSL